MNTAFKTKIFQNHRNCTQCPSKEEVGTFVDDLLGLLFPPYSNKTFSTSEDFEKETHRVRSSLSDLLDQELISKSMTSSSTEPFFNRIEEIYDLLQQDVTAMFEGDPAAQSEQEVIRSYPGFYAIAAYRIAHAMVQLEIPILPRMITEHAHSATGIDIHPSAKIGHHFCIDHGTGIVIGETTKIGNHVKIYQGVTLGALSVSKKDAKIKRHPTIGNHVVVYSGATILGGLTLIGDHSVIGGNVWITQSVPERTTVYYQNKIEGNRTTNQDVNTYKPIRDDA
jgi:serine O-acetyltransferase